MTLVLDHGQAQINLGPASDAASPTVLLIGFDRRRVTAVKRGENGGRSPAHVDVVHGIEEVARSGGVGKIAAPIPSHCDRIAAVVKAADGRILGVAGQGSEPL